MARTLRLRVVAEGVENAEQFAFLRSRKCDEAQGFYFSRPMSADDLTETLLANAGRASVRRLSISAG
ncbi:MAG TPA: EAL domain-containing protein [Thermoanaerobaculia bacterium]|nr:EAL domain-containing protein [Thermoanaerobaculia bacterium]